MRHKTDKRIICSLCGASVTATITEAKFEQRTWQWIRLPEGWHYLITPDGLVEFAYARCPQCSEKIGRI